METIVYLVRHGETNANAGIKFAGSSDIELSDNGRAQVSTLTDFFRNVRVDKVFSSPLKRALATARAVVGDKGIDINVDHELREINCGKWELLSFDEVDRRYPGQLIMWLKYTHMLRMPEGDTVEEVRVRATRALLRILRENEGKSVVITSHMMTLHTIVISLLGIPNYKMHSIPDALNASITELHFYTEGDRIEVQLVRYSDTSHMSDELRSQLVGGGSVSPLPEELCRRHEINVKDL